MRWICSVLTLTLILTTQMPLNREHTPYHQSMICMLIIIPTSKNINGIKLLETSLPGLISTKNLSFNTSPLLNGYRIRCTTIVAIDDKVSYVVYSDPMTIRCATQCENYSVDWDSDRKKVNVNLTENAKDSDIMIAVYDGNVLKACITGDYEDNEIDISEYADKGYTIRAFVWNNSLQPMGYVFERKDSPNYKVHWDMDNDSVRVELAENAKDSDIFIAAYENNVMKSCIMGDYENNEFDISKYVKNDYIIKIFVWDKNQKPMGSVYEK